MQFSTLHLTFGDTCSTVAQDYLSATNIQRTDKIEKFTTPKPVLLLGSHLDRLLDERSVISALLQYRPFTKPPPSLQK